MEQDNDEINISMDPLGRKRERKELTTLITKINKAKINVEKIKRKRKVRNVFFSSIPIVSTCAGLATLIYTITSNVNYSNKALNNQKLRYRR